VAAASQGDDSDGDVLDPRVVEDMFNLPGRTSDSLFLEILAIFMKVEPARIAGLHRLAAARMGEDLARQAHQLTGSCAVIGARQLQATARSLENGVHAGDCDSVAEKLADVDQAWSRLRAEFARRGLAVD